MGGHGVKTRGAGWLEGGGSRTERLSKRGFEHEPLRSEEAPGPRRAARPGEALSQETGSGPGLPTFTSEGDPWALV